MSPLSRLPLDGRETSPLSPLPLEVWEVSGREYAALSPFYWSDSTTGGLAEFWPDELLVASGGRRVVQPYRRRVAHSTTAARLGANGRATGGRLCSVGKGPGQREGLLRLWQRYVALARGRENFKVWAKWLEFGRDERKTAPLSPCGQRRRVCGGGGGAGRGLSAAAAPR